MPDRVEWLRGELLKTRVAHGLLLTSPGRRGLLSDEGHRFAVFYTKLASRVVAPVFAADQAHIPAPLRCALACIDRATDDCLTHAALAAARR